MKILKALGRQILAFIVGMGLTALAVAGVVALTWVVVTVSSRFGDMIDSVVVPLTMGVIGLMAVIAMTLMGSDFLQFLSDRKR